MRSHDFEEQFRVEQFDAGLDNIDNSCGLRHHSLGRNALPLLIGLRLLLIVLLDSVQEGLSGGGQLQVFHPHVDALGDDALPDLLVDDDSDGARVDVEDSPSAPVVVLVGHPLVDGSVHHDVHNISDLVGSERVGDVDGAVLLETFLELVSSSAFVSVAVSHVAINNY
jgi:hypothetical protein